MSYRLKGHFPNEAEPVGRVDDLQAALARLLFRKCSGNGHPAARLSLIRLR